MGMRYKAKVESQLEILMNKFESLVSNLEKNYYNDKRGSLMTHLNNMKQDLQLITDLIEKEDADLRYGQD